MDGDILELLMQADPGLEGRAVQDALRKRAAVGALIQGIGGRRFGPMGAGMVQSAERGQAGQREAVLRQAIEKMRGQVSAQQMAAKAAEADAARRARAAEADTARKHQWELERYRQGESTKRAKILADAKAAPMSPDVWRRKLPPEVRKKLDAAEAAARTARDAQAVVRANPEAFGTTKQLSEFAPTDFLKSAVDTIQTATRDPKHTEARAVVYRDAYQKINDLAGAALSKNEEARIRTFLPGPNDTAETILAKLDGAIKEAGRQAEDVHRGYGGTVDTGEPSPDETEEFEELRRRLGME